MGRGAPVGEAHRPPTIGAMAFFTPATGDTWLGLGEEPLPVQQVLSWVGLPDCGAVVLFTGNARNHAEGRTNVTGLAYEAYEEQVIPRFEEMVDEARRRWDPVGRLVILHRTGPVKIGDAAVLVAVSAPHREEAFAAGRWCIDTLKETVPIWKRETWEGGEHWAVDAQHIVDVTGADGRRIGDAEALLAVVPTDQQAGLESSGNGT